MWAPTGPLTCNLSKYTFSPMIDCSWRWWFEHYQHHLLVLNNLVFYIFSKKMIKALSLDFSFLTFHIGGGNEHLWYMNNFIFPLSLIWPLTCGAQAFLLASSSRAAFVTSTLFTISLALLRDSWSLLSKIHFFLIFLSILFLCFCDFDCLNPRLHFLFHILIIVKYIFRLTSV